MSSPFGETRTRVARRFAIIAPDSHVTSPLPWWQRTEGVILITPAMGDGGAGPRFVQYLITGESEGTTTGAAVGVERLVYVLAGEAILDGKILVADDFAWFPPDDSYELVSASGSKLLVFEKPYEALDEVAPSGRIVSSLDKSPTQPFMDDDDAKLTTLLPVDVAFDMAVNVFAFQPGATLPMVESHVMEHGLYMRGGQGVYRLDEHWSPVQAGDSIWMAPYCPQWFVAMGKEPASYIYYKDIHRDSWLTAHRPVSER